MNAAKNILTGVLALVIWIVGAMAATGSGETTAEAAAAAMHDALALKDQGAIIDAHVPEYSRAQLKPGVRAILDALPNAAPSAVRSVDEYRASAAAGAGVRVDFVTFRHAFFYPESPPFLVTVNLRKITGGDWQVAGVELSPLDPSGFQPPAQLTGGHFLAAGLAALSVLLSAAALATALLTPRLKRRLLWSLAILTLGFPVVAFNWSTGAFSLLLPTIQLNSGSVSILDNWVVMLGASTFKASVVSAWMIHFAPPLGALAFFLQAARGRLERRAPREAATPAAAGRPAPALRFGR